MNQPAVTQLKEKRKKRRQKVVAGRAREIFSGIYLDGEESGATKREKKKEKVKREEKEEESHEVEREIRVSCRFQVEDSGRTEKKSIPT